MVIMIGSKSRPYIFTINTDIKDDDDYKEEAQSLSYTCVKIYIFKSNLYN